MNISGSFYALVTVLILAFCVDEGVAIKCWVCRSETDPKCGEPFDNSTLPISNCAFEPELDHLPGVRSTMCKRIREKVNGEWQYHRGCAYVGEPGITSDKPFCEIQTGTNNNLIEYCTCNDKDGCNTGPLAYSNYLLILFGSVVTWYVTSFYNS